MPTRGATPKNIDEYIASFSPEVRAILKKIRLTIRQAALENLPAQKNSMAATLLWKPSLLMGYYGLPARIRNRRIPCSMR